MGQRLPTGLRGCGPAVPGVVGLTAARSDERGLFACAHDNAARLRPRPTEHSWCDNNDSCRSPGRRDAPRLYRPCQTIPAVRATNSASTVPMRIGVSSSRAIYTSARRCIHTAERHGYREDMLAWGTLGRTRLCSSGRRMKLCPWKRGGTASLLKRPRPTRPAAPPSRRLHMLLSVMTRPRPGWVISGPLRSLAVLSCQRVENLGRSSMFSSMPKINEGKNRGN